MAEIPKYQLTQTGAGVQAILDSVDDIQNDVGTLETNVGTLETNVGTLQTTVNDLEDRVSNAFTTRLATVTVGKNLGSYASLSAPSVSGYTFLCWVGSATAGWVGGTYIESMNSASTVIWVCSSTESSGTGNVNAWALYVAN